MRSAAKLLLRMLQHTQVARSICLLALLLVAGATASCQHADSYGMAASAYHAATAQSAGCVADVLLRS